MEVKLVNIDSVKPYPGNTTSTGRQEFPLAAAAAASLEGLPLKTLADHINAEHRAAKESARSAVEHARAAGLLLIVAKRQVGHGGWGDWLRGNFEGSDRTAQVYIRVAGRWAELESKAQRVADLPLRQAAALLAEPGRSVPKDRLAEEDWAAAATSAMGAAEELGEIMAAQLVDLPTLAQVGVFQDAGTRLMTELGIVLRWTEGPAVAGNRAAAIGLLMRAMALARQTECRGAEMRMRSTRAYGLLMANPAAGTANAT